MRVAFNATPLLSPFTGIGQYAYQLAKNIQQSDSVDFDFFYGLKWSKTLRERAVPGITSVKSAVKKFIPNSYVVNRMLQQARFNRGITSGAAEIYHEPNSLAFACDKPTVVTVHDLSWIRYPETHPQNRVRNMNKHFESSLSRAALVLTDSEFVKRELMELFGLQSERIQSVPLGVEECFHPRSAEQNAALMARYDLTHGKYLLTVGTLEPRKNLQVVLEAYQLLPAAIRKRFPLIVVGMKGWNTSEIEKKIAPLVRAGEIRLTGYLPREELAGVIAGATAMVYPSLYEGFGLPPLEAMACGVPVISSNVASLPEVLGDTGLMVNPHDVASVAAAMQLIAIDHNTRGRLSKLALARSAGFTWEKCAERTISLYRRVV